MMKTSELIEALELAATSPEVSVDYCYVGLVNSTLRGPRKVGHDVVDSKGRADACRMAAAFLRGGETVRVESPSGALVWIGFTGDAPA